MPEVLKSVKIKALFVLCFNGNEERGITMGVSVAEYYGQRTDIDTPVIVPVNGELPCPFSSGNVCKKLRSRNHPVCSVRKTDGTLWIVCSDRLCATKKNITLCEHQSNILHDIGKHIFNTDVSRADICVKREERLNVVEGTKYNAD